MDDAAPTDDAAPADGAASDRPSHHRPKPLEGRPCMTGRATMHHEADGGKG
jgi:hypothetical protein